MPLETSGLTFGDLTSSGKGARSVPITGENTWAPGELKVLWQPRSFDGSDQNRVSISFQTTDALEVDIRKFEECIVAYVGARQYLGDLSPAQVKERFVSMLKVSDKGYRSLRAKMNFTGRNGVQCWDSDKQKRDLPEDWLCCSVSPIFRIKGLWLMSRDWGILCEMEHAQISEATAACPF